MAPPCVGFFVLKSVFYSVWLQNLNSRNCCKLLFIIVIRCDIYQGTPLFFLMLYFDITKVDVVLNFEFPYSSNFKD